MKLLNSILSSTIIRCMLPLAGLIVPQTVHAAVKTWNAIVGAESDDLGRQGWAFLPNELWIHAGDSVTWTFASDEPHTVSFLTSNQLRPTIAHEDRKSTRLNSSHSGESRMPSSA